MHGEYKIPGGKLVVVDLEVHDGRLCAVQVSGDFFLEPDSALASMNQALEGMSVDTGEAGFAATIAAQLARAESFGISAEGVAIAVCRALREGAGT